MVGADAPEKILKIDTSILAKKASFFCTFLPPYDANKTNESLLIYSNNLLRIPYNHLNFSVDPKV